MARLRFRWTMQLGSVDAGEFKRAMGLLPNAEQQDVLRFVHSADQTRALCSRFLQRCVVAAALEVPFREVEIRRTRGNKPFTTNAKPAAAANFNFNVSHEGDYVALAAEPFHIVGLDVAAPRSARPGRLRPLDEYVASFKQQLEQGEWRMVQSSLLAGDEQRAEACFQRIWSLKEAFVKARGDGLGFQPLSRAAFTFPEGCAWADRADLWLDGVYLPSWRFTLQALPNNHWVTVACGPPSAVVDAHGVFKSSLPLLDVPDAGACKMEDWLAAGDEKFVELQLGDLMRQHGFVDIR